jgi:hypothetical protein
MTVGRVRWATAGMLAAAFGAVVWASPSAAANPVTSRVSVSSAGVQANGPSGKGGVAISADGRLVAFVSTSSNLVAGDTNGVADVFVHNTRTHTTRRVSVATSGAQGDATSTADALAISPDGRFVSFTSSATNLSTKDDDAPCGGQPCPDVYIHDLRTGTTRLLLPIGTDAGADHLVLSAGAKFFAYTTFAFDDRLIRCRRSTLRCRLASLPPPGFRTDSTDSVVSLAGLSQGGRFVLFRLFGIDSAPHPTAPLAVGVFVRDMRSRITLRVTTRAADIAGGLSPQGRFVLFTSGSPNLVPNDTNHRRDVFVRDLATGTTRRVNVSSSGRQANRSSLGVGISSGGRDCMFTSAATDLVAHDRNGDRDLFVRDRVRGTTSRVNVSTSGLESNGLLRAWALAAEGRWVAFDSDATNLVGSDTNAAADVFARGPLR